MLSDRQSVRLFNTLVACSQIVGGFAVLFVVIWMTAYESGFAWTSHPEQQFHYHPTLMIMGFLFITGEAILAFRVFRNETKHFAKLVHLTLHSVALVFIVISLKAVWDSHDYNRDASGTLEPLPNLYSLHSWIGLTLVTFYFMQYAVGFTTFFYPGLAMSMRTFVMPFHRLFGYIIFLFVGITILMGVTEFSAWKHKCWTQDKVFCGEQAVGNFVGLCAVSFVALVLILVLNSRWSRSPSPEEESLRA